MKPSRFLSIFICGLILLSCAEGGIVPDTEVDLKLELQKSEAGRSKGYFFVDVTASGEWSLALDFGEGVQSWATLTQYAGKDSKKGIILSYDALTGTGTRSLAVNLTCRGKSVSRTFTQGAAASSGMLHSANAGWLELPATDSEDGMDWGLVKMTSPQGTSMRNYSYYWDYDNLVAHWVAYPLNRSLIGGSVDRTNEWGVDPNLSTTYQPVLYKAYRGGFDRGHQLPSADRLLNRDANVQTFYGVNMTPQLGAGFNQSIWSSLEGKVRSWAGSCDTLYVVTGCVVRNNSTSGSYGEVGGYALDNDGKKVAVPTAYYKAVLRYKKDGANATYQACAIYLEHKNYSSSYRVSKSDSMSIDELERITGVDFFVNLPKVIGESEAAKVEAQDPSTVSIWW